MADEKITRSSSESDNAKINKIRNWMTSQNIDVYLVPHSDRFQSEYLPASEERLAWLTKFTGSHGMAVVLKDRAALYVSGLYLLQASLQIDTGTYDIINSPPENPAIWLKKNLGENAKIGFDPWLFTVTQVMQWQHISAQEKWQLQPVLENPIDLYWTDRPADPAIPGVVHGIQFAGKTTEEKISALLEKKSSKANYLLISDPSITCWLLNMRGQDVAHTPLIQSVALLDKEGQVTLFADPRKITSDLRASWGNHVAVEDLPRLFAVLEKMGGAVQLDPTQCAYAVKDFCVNHQIKVIEAVDPALLLRAQKNETEINGAIKAHEIDAKAFADFTSWLKARDFKSETVTELDVIAKLHECRAQTGECVDESFGTIAGFGPNGAIIHYSATPETNLQLKEGSLLLLDSGGQYRFGTTDVTRVFSLGPPTVQMKKHYTAVLKGLIALTNARFPVGSNGAQLDTIARAPIWAIGEDYAHGTGHGVGSYLSVHEGPTRITKASFSPQSVGPVEEGMILSIEPGIYIEGEYGIRLENLVVVVEDKRPGDVKEMLAFKTLTKIPFEENLIDFNILDEKEKAFLEQFR